MPDIFYIPSGPKNLASMFPSVDFNSVESYYVTGLSGASVLAISPIFVKGCCCQENDIVIYFLNYLGAFDIMPFPQPTITHESTDIRYQKTLNFPLAKTDYGEQRFNVRSNDTYESKNVCVELGDMNWVQELFDSPLAFLQWTGTQGQGDDYIPITILPSKFTKQDNSLTLPKPSATIQFKLANEFFIIRN